MITISYGILIREDWRSILSRNSDQFIVIADTDKVRDAVFLAESFGIPRQNVRENRGKFVKLINNLNPVCHVDDNEYRMMSLIKNTKCILFHASNVNNFQTILDFNKLSSLI